MDLTQRFETVKELALDERTNLNCIDEQGFTVLMRAGYNSDDNTILFLTTTPGVKERVDVSIKSYGKKASDYAKHRMPKRAIQALEKEQVEIPLIHPSQVPRMPDFRAIPAAAQPIVVEPSRLPKMPPIGKREQSEVAGSETESEGEAKESAVRSTKAQKK